MGLRTGSERDTCRGTEGAQTSRHTELRSVPSANSTFAQVLPSPDSLPSTKMAEQLLVTWGQRRERKRSGGFRVGVKAGIHQNLQLYCREIQTFTVFSSAEEHVAAEVTSYTFSSRLMARTIAASDTGWLVSIAVLMIMLLWGARGHMLRVETHHCELKTL